MESLGAECETVAGRAEKVSDRVVGLQPAVEALRTDETREVMVEDVTISRTAEEFTGQLFTPASRPRAVQQLYQKVCRRINKF